MAPASSAIVVPFLTSPGGGTLLGAAFVSGRGGSVDVLTTPLINANPASGYSAAGNKVYAIVPGVVTAPVVGGYATAWNGAVPTIGQQITIPADVAGLPAGTYTLLPASYALMPGAYRIELGAQTTNPISGAIAMPNGSYLTTGVTSVANTAIRDSLATQVTITPGAAVRGYSQYNEQGYDAFQLAKAATFGTVRPLLPGDGKFLTININTLGSGTSNDPALVFDGTADFTPVSDGYGGYLVLLSGNASLQSSNLVITGTDSTTTRTTGVTPIAASTINAIGAPNLYVGAAPIVQSGATEITFANNYYTNITLESGAVADGLAGHPCFAEFAKQWRGDHARNPVPGSIRLAKVSGHRIPRPASRSVGGILLVRILPSCWRPTAMSCSTRPRVWDRVRSWWGMAQPSTRKEPSASMPTAARRSSTMQISARAIWHWRFLPSISAKQRRWRAPQPTESCPRA